MVVLAESWVVELLLPDRSLRLNQPGILRPRPEPDVIKG